MKTIFIKTFGCTLNQRDSQDISFGILESKSEGFADIIVINTCGVKEQTETKIYKYVTDNIDILKTKNTILTGCLLDIDSEKLKTLLPKAKMFGIKDKQKLIAYLDKYRNKKTKEKKIEITKTIIIANGCLGNCAYCAVKFARGRLKSKSITDIKNEITEAVNNGAKEILLTAQDTGCYGLDINSDISKLLKAIVAMPEEFKIRLGMGNPQHFKKYKKEISEILKSEKMYKFLHVPIQSGSDKVLKKMNRYYTKKEYTDLISYLKKNISNLTLSTDIIVGFPTETEKDFLETLEIIKKCKFDIVNISRFGKRKGIEANNYKDLHGRIKKERSRIVTEICSKIALENNQKLVGKTKEVIITELGKNNQMIARTKEYKQVIFEKKNQKLGDILKLKIIDAKPGYLIGKRIS